MLITITVRRESVRRHGVIAVTLPRLLFALVFLSVLLLSLFSLLFLFLLVSAMLASATGMPL